MKLCYSLTIVAMIVGLYRSSVEAQTNENLNFGANDNALQQIELRSGILYHYPYYTTKGHPFLIMAEPVWGRITIKDSTYYHIPLRYDIFNQQLIATVQYTDDQVREIVIPMHRLNAFEIEGKRFEIKNIANAEPTIYEICNTGKTQCIIHWWKSRNIIQNFGETGYEFSPQQKTMYLLRGGKQTRFTNNRNFASTFNNDKKAAIKKYLRQWKINVKKADSNTLGLTMINLNKEFGL